MGIMEKDLLKDFNFCFTRYVYLKDYEVSEERVSDVTWEKSPSRTLFKYLKQRNLVG